MGAVIVQCPSCQARFHLAQERIPEKGARVRCSRCEHRFYVTSTGDVSESKPRKARDSGERAAQSGSSPGSGSSSGSRSGSSSSSAGSLDLSASSSVSQPRVRTREAATTAMDAMGDPAKPARPRSVGAVAPQEDADLDDPQFLFDETQSSAELPYTPGDLPEEEEPSSAALGEIPGRGGAAHGRSARAPDTDVTPQVPPAPPPESPTAAESSTDSDSGSWLSNDDEAIPDIRAQRDELVAQQSPTALAEPQDGFEMTSDPPERPAPEPPFPHAARVEAPRTLPREVEQPPAAAGRYAGSGGAVLVARSTPERSTREGAPVEGPRSITLDRVGALVSVLMGCALIFAGGHALLLQRRAPAGPERVRLEGGEVSSVEVLQLRDAEGHRVLAVRGLLRSSGAPPRVQLQLIDASGGPVGAPHAARPGFLGDAELTTEKLGPLLAPGERPRSTGDERGFTVLIRDPPLEAERFTLQQGA